MLRDMQIEPCPHKPRPLTCTFGRAGSKGKSSTKRQNSEHPQERKSEYSREKPTKGAKGQKRQGSPTREERPSKRPERSSKKSPQNLADVRQVVLDKEDVVGCAGHLTKILDGAVWHLLNSNSKKDGPHVVGYCLEKLGNEGLSGNICMGSATTAWGEPFCFAKCPCSGERDHRRVDSTAHNFSDEIKTFRKKFQTDYDYRSSMEISDSTKEKLLKRHGKELWQDFR